MADEWLIPPSGNEPVTGKTLAALRASRMDSNDLISWYGSPELVPSSVMRQARIKPDETRDALAADRSYVNSLPEYNKAAIADPKLSGDIKGMHRMNSGSLTGALSKFPQDIGRSVVRFYADPGALVVDPFAGHNSRMELCVRAGYDYIGCDLSTEFMDFNKERCAILRAEFPNRKIKVHHTDSRKQPIPDQIGDMTITSPPYYDIEYYGDEAEQMSNCPTYKDFLDSMRQCIQENYRTLKPGAFSCWFINDFRRGGIFHSYHKDIISLGESVGFINWDIIVIDLGRGLRDGFVNSSRRLKIIPKRHEYCVVLRKPGWKDDSV